ncbi:MAG: hypothetical protein LWW86_06235 [Micrococcales bacterium]|nr:hypothetical protein [Micrococcales bacterium]
MSSATRARGSRRDWVAAAVAFLAALLVLGPGLGRGCLLVRDMACAPQMPWSPRLLGLTSELPRAVPSDLLPWALGLALPGDLAQKALLLAILALGGVGAGRLVSGTWGAGAAALAYVWAPAVFERLAIGQWALLVGYAALPWVVRAAVRLARRETSFAPLAGSLVAGSLGGAPAWVLLALAAPAAYLAGLRLRPEGRGGGRALDAAAIAATLAAVALPWALPSVLGGQSGAGGEQAAEAFRARADTPGGVVLSMVSGGGIWNVDVVPPERAGVIGLLAALLVVAVALAGIWLRWSEPSVRAAAVVGALGLSAALLTQIPAMAGVLAHLPGGGLLRDNSRFVLVWWVAVAAGIGCAAEWLVRARWQLLAALVAALPVAALPSLAWGLHGRLVPVEVPDAFGVVARQLDRSGGEAVLLPFETYRRYGWNGDRASLSPLPRMTGRRVVAADDLVVTTGGGRVRLAGEDPRAADVRAALAAADPVRALAGLGVRWVAVDWPGVEPPAGLRLVAGGPGALLYEVPGPIGGAPAGPRAAAVLGGDLAAYLLVTGMAVGSARARRRAEKGRVVGMDSSAGSAIFTRGKRERGTLPRPRL